MNYQLTIKIDFEAMDDIAARQEMSELMDIFPDTIKQKKYQVKLQEIFKDKPPRGIKK